MSCDPVPGALAAPEQQTVRYHPALAWLAALGSAWVFLLVALGAVTTTIGAGMAFPDWPLSDGSINPHGWLTDAARFAEHSHRLSGTLMGLLTLALAAGLWRFDARRWLRWLGASAVAVVVVQGIIGGQRVRLDAWYLPQFEMSVGQILRVPHGILAQAFVVMLVAMTAAVSRPWIDAPPATFFATARLRRLGLLATTLVLMQLVIAATMRHAHAGLAIPTFPLTPQGSVLPQAWNFAVGVHFAHRAMAAMLVMVIGLFALAVWRERTASVLLRRTAVVMVALVGLQLILGIAVIWTLRDPFYTTAHVVAGAGTLAATFLLTWFCYRNRIESACTGDRGRERRPVRPRERIGDESGRDALKPRPAVTARAGVLRG